MANQLTRDTIAAHDFRPDYGTLDKAIYGFATFGTAKAADLTLGVLPAGAIVTNVKITVLTASNAVTTGTLSVGKTGTNTFYVNAVDVKGGGTGPLALTITNSAAVLTVDTTVVVRYADTGGAATAGNFFVMVAFVVPA